MRKIDDQIIRTFDDSLQRCGRSRAFLDDFYERFLASSPKVREKFSDTDFTRQKRALRASFYMLLLAVEDGGPGAAQKYLTEVARRHSVDELDVGAELYDFWLDSLLATVRQHDPQFDDEVEHAWEEVMGVGIRFLLDRYSGGKEAMAP